VGGATSSGFSGSLQPSANTQTESKLSFSNHFIVSSEVQKEGDLYIGQMLYLPTFFIRANLNDKHSPTKKKAAKNTAENVLQRLRLSGNNPIKELDKGVDEGIRTPDPQNHNLML
jgi:hypothetical protein